ncbi:MAG TPA: type II toxin-antitoxin system RatA family toxin [Rhodanobacteraceae bacterium]|jgi:ribosome-associated toxin RatA of RatAB toxin-antitoxin module|nr:type II toxin-antitoxin system RatA family toxin [Rhodanobacteraceae bacterium]
MTHVHREALVHHTCAQMFDLVNDVEAYPRRFAWCAGARVRERGEGFAVARLDLRFAGLTQHFVTRNEIERPHRIGMRFVEGPFRTLSGEWAFTPLGNEGCKTCLTLDFEISNPLTGLALRIGFQQLADRMVNDFVAESDRTYA